MKELSLVFSEKSELQHKRNSILFALLGFPSICGSQNDMFQWKLFLSNIALSDPGELRLVKKNLYPKTGKKFNFLHFQTNFLIDLLTFNFFLAFWKIQIFLVNFLKNFEKCQCFSVESENG